MTTTSMLTTEQLLLPSGQWYVFVKSLEGNLDVEIESWLADWKEYEIGRGALSDTYRSYERRAHYHAWFQVVGQEADVT